MHSGGQTSPHVRPLDNLVQRTAAAVVSNVDPPPAFGRFLDALGWKVAFPIAGDALTAEVATDSEGSDSDEGSGSAAASASTCSLPYFADVNTELVFHAMPLLAACSKSIRLEVRCTAPGCVVRLRVRRKLTARGCVGRVRCPNSHCC